MKPQISPSSDEAEATSRPEHHGTFEGRPGVFDPEGRLQWDIITLPKFWQTSYVEE